MNNPTKTKRCHRCGETKGHTAFSIDRSKPDQLNSHCRACRNQARNARRAQDDQPKPPPPAPDPRCVNCQAGRHGPACTAAIFGPWCPCSCRAVLGLTGPFEFPDPTAPDGHRYEEAS